MKRSSVVALVATGLGLGSLLSVAATSLHAATTTNSTSTTNTATTTTMPHRMHDDTDRLSSMATLLGMSVTDLQTALNSGKEFYQIAAEHSITYDQVQAKQQDTYKAKLDDMVKVGYISQAQADTFLKNWQTQAATSPMGFGFGGGHGRGMMMD